MHFNFTCFLILSFKALELLTWLVNLCGSAIHHVAEDDSRPPLPLLWFPGSCSHRHQTVTTWFCYFLKATRFTCGTFLQELGGCLEGLGTVGCFLAGLLLHLTRIRSCALHYIHIYIYLFPPLPALHPGLVYFQALLVLGGSHHCCP